MKLYSLQASSKKDKLGSRFCPFTKDVYFTLKAQIRCIVFIVEFFSRGLLLCPLGNESSIFEPSGRFLGFQVVSLDMPSARFFFKQLALSELSVRQWSLSWKPFDVFDESVISTLAIPQLRFRARIVAPL